MTGILFPWIDKYFKQVKYPDVVEYIDLKRKKEFCLLHDGFLFLFSPWDITYTHFLFKDCCQGGLEAELDGKDTSPILDAAVWTYDKEVLFK